MILITGAASAEPPSLTLPLICTPGEDCWPVRYVDHDPGPGGRDYRCGPETGDGHQGTDIAIRDLRAMADGVEVVAAAAGTVIGIRDGESDLSPGQRTRPAMAGRHCGNGVRLDHGGGWTSQVCHLRRGSVRVALGDRVEAGDPLGLVGLSGATSFPHLHFGVQ
ncbi:MAG: M23 family metallopeptidase, partial [Geminicoccaceae bacterium]|nr:M23 family metallopeptidase [Geminicoccaceae bacterium]